MSKYLSGGKCIDATAVPDGYFADADSESFSAFTMTTLPAGCSQRILPSCRQEGQEVRCQRHHLHLLRSRLRHVVRKGQEGRPVPPPAGWDLLDALPGEDVREQARRNLRGVRFDGADLHGGGSNFLVSKRLHFIFRFEKLWLMLFPLQRKGQRGNSVVPYSDQ